MNIYPPLGWTEPQTYYVAANWTLDAESTQVAMSNRGNAIRAQSNALNFLLARCPRPLFQVSIPAASVTETDHDPYFIWRYWDDFNNGRTYTVHMVGYGPAAKPSDHSTALQYAGATHYTNEFVTFGYEYTNGPNLFQDAKQLSYQIIRGAAGDGWAMDGINTLNGLGLLCITVYEDPLDLLVDGTHTLAYPDSGRYGQEQIASIGQNHRVALHTRRSTGLPMAFWWGALGNTGTPAAPGDVTCLRCDQTSYYNAFDNGESVAVRSVDSPGFRFNAQYLGRGPDSEIAGQRVKVICTVLGYADGGNGTVKFVGPNSFSNNEIEISLADGGGLAWYGSDASFVYLDTTVAADNATLAMNKIDPFLKVSAGDMYVYGMCGRVVYE